MADSKDTNITVVEWEEQPHVYDTRPWDSPSDRILRLFSLNSVPNASTSAKKTLQEFQQQSHACEVQA